MRLADVRAEVVEGVEAAGYPVHAYGTPRLNPPCVIIDEPEDYLGEGGLLNKSLMSVTFDLWLFQKNLQNKEATVAMDNMIEAVIFNLGDWQLVPNRMQAHVLTPIGDKTFYVTKLSITNTTELGGQ